jgi:ring-1,2-phenylacetyl-CoA epoxidase subunit PaaE
MFKKLSVKEVKQETENTVSVAFDIPNELAEDFNYRSGQYITIRTLINGEDVRRAYSLCSAPFENDFRIGVKKIENGKMSTFLNDHLKAGDEIEVMPPAGNFVVKDGEKNIVAFAAGSGITPILSMVKSVLSNDGSFTLYYGNRTSEETIFKNELDALKNQYGSKFNLNYIYSKEGSNDALFEGRITADKCKALIESNENLLKADAFYSCGPEEMILAVSAVLKELGVNENKIRFELFTAPSTDVEESRESGGSQFDGESDVTIIVDGEEFDFPLNGDGEFILDAAVEAGADVPFACKGAVCCTCKAQVVEGKATMEMNYALSEEEVAEGYILTCQAHPASEKVVVDYDVT